MNLLIAFCPFALFIAVHYIWGVTAGLMAATVVSALIVARDCLPGRKIKLLEVGSLLLFGGLSVISAMGLWSLSILQVRLAVDVGLLAIVVTSLLVRRPFTLPYAAEQVPAEFRGSTEFMQANTKISSAWAIALAVICIADVVMIYVPSEEWIGIAVIVLSIFFAVRYTKQLSESGKAPK